MPAPVSKDSMSRCDTASSLYDTVRRPNAPYVPPQAAVNPAAPSKDTIETTQQRINREMMERFQNTSSRVPHHSFVVVAQVGKYLFLAIMLPPYLCFFGIPRWMLMTALPQLVISVKTLVLKVGKFFNELSKRVVDRMKGALEQLIGDSLRIINHQTKNLLKYVLDKASLLANGVKQLAQVAQQSMQKMSSLFAHWKEGLVDIIRNRRELLEFLKDQALQIASSVTRTLLYPLDLIDKHLIKPILKWCTQKINAIGDRIKFAVNSAKAAVEKVSRPIITLVERATKTTYSYIQHIAQYVYQQANLFLQPYIDIVTQAFNHTKEKIANRISKISSAIRKKTEEIATVISEAIKSNIQIPMQLVPQFLGWAWWQASQIAKSPWQYLKRGGSNGKRTLMALQYSFVNHAKKVTHRMKSLALGVWEGLFSLLRKFYGALCWIGNQLMTLPRKAMLGLLWGLTGIKRFIKACLYGLRVFIAFGWVVSSSGMILVRELTREIGKWMRINNLDQ